MTKKLIDRFESRFTRGPTTECWEWTGTLNYKGYGKFWYPKGASAHRFSYLIHVGKIPGKLVVDHLCRNRKCVNPLHLRLLTARENTLIGFGSGAINKRKTECKNGHPLTRRPGSKVRRCEICTKANRKTRYHQNRAAAIKYSREWYQLNKAKR